MAKGNILWVLTLFLLVAALLRIEAPLAMADTMFKHAEEDTLPTDAARKEPRSAPTETGLKQGPPSP